jgi:hypothetical protein
MESHGGMILMGEYRRKTCPIVTVSTTNSIWTDLGENPGLCGETSD